jgi:hypothetical protein
LENACAPLALQPLYAKKILHRKVILQAILVEKEGQKGKDCAGKNGFGGVALKDSLHDYQD